MAVTGVSGSGKSSLVTQILHPALAQRIWGSRAPAGRHDRIEGIDLIDKVIEIDQSPIGRTPRSNPATYTGLWTPLRELLAAVPEARLRGYKPGRFSFNVKGGPLRGVRGRRHRPDRNALPARRHVACEVCKGKRYNRETLEIHYKGKNVAEILEMNVEEALKFLRGGPVDPQQARDAQRRGHGLHPPRTARDHAVRRGGPAREAGNRAVQASDRQDLLHPGRADHGPPLRRRGPPAQRPRPARGERRTRSSSSSTTSTSSRQPTGSSTSGPRAVTRAGSSWPRGRQRRSQPTLPPIRASTSDRSSDCPMRPREQAVRPVGVESPRSPPRCPRRVPSRPGRVMAVPGSPQGRDAASPA